MYCIYIISLKSFSLTVSYCSTSCQRSDWPHHKAACLPVRVADVGAAGEEGMSDWSCHKATCLPVRVADVGAAGEEGMSGWPHHKAACLPVRVADGEEGRRPDIF
jgi:hypothetical protein